jgi:hypothetical protein
LPYNAVNVNPETPSESLIEFLAHPEVKGVFPEPYPASRAVPQWFRNMPVTGPEEARTVKRCPPFLEALTCGYIIPLAMDVKLTRTATELKVEMPPIDYPLLGMHRHEEFPGAPFGPIPLLKFINPWIVKTPPGYSTLFVQPLNHFEAQIMPLAGLVETDVFYRPVAFPTVVLMQPNTELILKAGTPLVQAIPIKREAWRSSAGEWDPPLMVSVEQELQARPHLYKEEHWQKKSYT